MKPTQNTTAHADPPVDWELTRKFAAITRWMDHLDKAPKFRGVLDVFAQDPYVLALLDAGLQFLPVLVRLAKAGHPRAVRELVRRGGDFAEALEAIAADHPELLRGLAEGRADWPVMVCRHETSAKPVTLYLDRIGLGRRCVINADGAKAAKYSLRTPINRFVWRKLSGLRLSIQLLGDLPKIAAIDLDSLPRLTKAKVKVWADKALMPYFDALYADFHSVPEFASILRRPGVRTRGQQRREIRKDVIRALQSLAPPPGLESA